MRVDTCYDEAMSPSDVELLEHWRDGDLVAGDQLFNRHFASIHRFFRNKVDRGIEDLIQSTFVACLESERRFAGRGGFRSFLLGIARHKLYGHYRDVLSSREDADLGQQSFADLAPGITTDLAQRAEGQLLLAALRGLPMEQQVVLELFYWESMTAGEIAEACELPEGTVRTRLRTARQNLAQSIANSGAAGRVLADAGAELHATLATRDELRRRGVDVRSAGEGEVEAARRVRDGVFSLVVSTVPGRADGSGDAVIRRAALWAGVPCLTSVEAARECAVAGRPGQDLQVRSLQAWEALARC